MTSLKWLLKALPASPWAKKQECVRTILALGGGEMAESCLGIARAGAVVDWQSKQGLAYIVALEATCLAVLLPNNPMEHHLGKWLTKRGATFTL